MLVSTPCTRFDTIQVAKEAGAPVEVSQDTAAPAVKNDAVKSDTVIDDNGEGVTNGDGEAAVEQPKADSKPEVVETATASESEVGVSVLF